MADETRQWHLAKDRKFQETIVFIHHFGGSPKTLRRHIELVNEMGFNAVSFQLKFNELKFPMDLPITSSNEFGIFAAWRDQIENVLNRVDGPKIVFAFSNPSFSALSAISNRQAIDIKACICDSGPALNIMRSWWNLVREKYKSRNLPFKLAMVPVGYIFVGHTFKATVARVLGSLPEGFPVLSIRGWQDPLIPYEEIEDFFDVPSKIDVKVLSLPEAKHLDGLKNHAGEYIPPLKEFLQKVATRVD